MSLILEALKKSEAERRRGQSPDLFGQALGNAPARREIPRVWPLLLLGLILLASAWMIWSGGSRGEAPTAPATPAPQDETSAPAKIVYVPTPALPPTKPGHKPSTKPAATAPATVPDPFVQAEIASTAPEPAPATEEALPTLSALDAGSRAALPPLKLSMHVYADDPGKRFAIIDGQRITEGALLAGGVVESIRRDGVVITINGRRLLLPKP